MTKCSFSQNMRSILMSLSLWQKWGRVSLVLYTGGNGIKRLWPLKCWDALMLLLLEISGALPCLDFPNLWAYPWCSEGRDRRKLWSSPMTTWSLQMSNCTTHERIANTRGWYLLCGSAMSVPTTVSFRESRLSSQKGALCWQTVQGFRRQFVLVCTCVLCQPERMHTDTITRYGVFYCIIRLLSSHAEHSCLMDSLFRNCLAGLSWMSCKRYITLIQYNFWARARKSSPIWLLRSFFQEDRWLICFDRSIQIVVESLAWGAV